MYVVLDDLGADEATFEVGVDDAGALRGLPAAPVGPGLDLHFAGGDEGFKVQHVVGGFDKAVASALGEADVLQEHLAFFVGLEFGDISLGACGHDEDVRALVLYGFAHGVDVGVAADGGGFVDVAHVEHGLRRKQEKVPRGGLLFLRVELHGAGAFALEQGGAVGAEHVVLGLGVLVPADLCHFLYALDACLYGLQIFQLQFGVYDFLVAYGVYRAVDVDYVAVVEAAEHVNDGVGLADVG